MILNLKRLNKFLDYKYFKMESLQNVLELIRRGVYMASIDLKHAFIQYLFTKPPSLLVIFCRRIFEICMYAKRIWISHANIYKSFKNTIFYS